MKEKYHIIIKNITSKCINMQERQLTRFNRQPAGKHEFRRMVNVNAYFVKNREGMDQLDGSESSS